MIPILGSISSEFDGEKTYGLSALDQNAGVFIPDTNNIDNLYSSATENGSGSMVITKWDSTDSLVSGTFSFTAQNIINQTNIDITEGSFTNIKVSIDDDSSNPSTENFSVEFDGSVWEQTDESIVGMSIAGFISITAFELQETFSVIMPSNITPGTYPLDGGEQTITYMDNGESFVSTSGTLEVIENENNKIVAEFEFIGTSTSTETITFSNGEFSVNYEN